MTTNPAWPADAQPEQPCTTCKGALWVEDGEQDRGAARTPGAGLVPCGACNEGNWDSPWPYPGWPGRCREFSCDDATDPHPCPLFHDPMVCERRVPLDGCGCDLSPDEPEWCPNQFCHDRVHADGTHTDENGRPFRGAEPSWSDDEDDGPVDEPVGRRPFPLTPIHDQLVAEQTYPELT